MSKPFRILHVDDDPDFADLTAEFLERENDRFAVVTETSAAAALDRLDDERFDCVVSDYQMPRTDGLELLDAVREEFPDLPFILFTNHGSEQVAASAIEKGVTSYLQKETSGTVQYAMLANRIRNHVEKHRTERRARRLEREYELIARTASDVFWTLDRSTGTVWLSDGIRHFGYDPESVEPGVDVTWLFERIHPDDRERVRSHREALLAGEESAFDELTSERGETSTEFRFRRADGTYADCHARGIVVFDDGEASRIVGTLRDVTERKQRRRELEETTEKLRAVIEASPDAINVVDEDGNVELWNPAAEEMFGWTEAEVVGDPLPIVPDDRKSEFRRFRGELFDEEPQPVAGYETKRERKDGTLIDVSISTAPVRDTDGEATGTMAVIEDVTERKERKRRLDALSEAFPDIAFLIDEEGRHVELLASPESEELLYTDPDGILGERFHDIFPSEQADEFLSLVRTTLETGRSQTLEYALDVQAGTRWFEARTTPIPTEIDDRRAVVWVARDITERTERERELRQYEGIVREMNDGVVVVHEGMIRDTNPQVSEMIGYSPEELRDEPMEEFIAPEDRETVRQRYRQRVAGEEPPNTYEIEILSKEGGRIPVEITAARVEYDDQPATVSIVRDISERKERQRELEAAERRFDAVFNNPLSFMALLDTDGTVTEINDTALEFVGRSDDDVRGDPFPETPWWNHSERLQNDLRSWIERAADGELVRFEAVNRAPGGEQVTVDGILHPIREDGDVVSLLAAGRDISERKAREQELERQNDRLEEFVSIVSHDLRNPLNVADGRLTLAQDDCDSDHLDEVERAHDRMETLIEDLLALAREGETPTEVGPVDLADIAETSWQNVETGAATLAVETDRTIRADRGRLTQLFENLFRNATEHAGDDVTVTVGDLDDGLYVEDDGPGIDPDERDRVFESGYTTTEDGTGFGLSIVREICDAHDWDIRVTEGESGGARFEITGVEFTTADP